MRFVCLPWALLGLLVACSDQPSYELDDQPPCPALGAACDVEPGTSAAVTGPVTVAPGDALPTEVVSQLAHNNLDIAWHRGRLFFAFRTAPYHFASPDTALYVVSTADQEHWTFETTIAIGTDLREPRFLAIGERLFLYAAVLGKHVGFFEPQYTLVSEYLGPADWSEPERVLADGFIAWRTRILDGLPTIFGYVGGENIYETDGEPVRVSWLTTADGRAFSPAVPDREVVLEGGTSETDAVRLDDGALVAVSRNELGDESGWGSKICRAEADEPGDWQCAADPRKYDSPLMFRHKGDVYLIARRQVTETGHYDLHERDLSPEDQTSDYEFEYWITPKRCALWKVDPDALTVDWVLDLPSAGDTCFPGLVDLGMGRYLVYDYTSPLDGDLDISWMEAQFGPTEIHWLTLTLP
ncbi:MAG TPA: hypothetical protein VIG06_26510 [Kofleriaceae bacterium]